ncbi:class I SAM-dependent methyltransferase [Aquimarina sp. 2201CG14-23]|uniref:class I SAM-dependent methyltransferase n=1 Tax=Aquimarina mycalae TaxID=3040073 RepID=UPI0024782843|nr:class I SAM-dependent methyltransferase [Aquimarina sp. 2201CG14-23]MDH7446974.1 class I SAM-dependent methyltransferase [Aquimarina sp. 2201CG14-23]
MLTKQEKKTFREELFRHLDGIVIAPVAYALFNKKITNYLLLHKTASISEIAKEFQANEGYLNVGLRMLSSQGWLDYSIKQKTASVSINEKTKVAFDHFHLYEGVVHLLEYSGKFHPRKFELEPFQKLEKLFIPYLNRFDIENPENQLTSIIQEQILKHIEGILVGPTIVHLGMGGMFHKYFMEASFSADEYHRFPKSFDAILTFLSHLGWFSKNNENYTFTNKGLFFAKRATAYGVTVSYIPMFRQMNELLFGNSNILWNTENNTDETHVDREMNVWGSGGAHATYFKKIDEIIIRVFNKPLDEQPKGILDMGCGNGAFLIHLFEIIESKTLRGKHLDDHPLFLVGADYNKAALKVTRANLIQADIWAKVIWGDISDPDLLEKDLNENYSIELKDLLSVRTFLDHNRIWSEPITTLEAPSNSTGAYAYRGKLLNNDDVERNLKDHFKKWAPHIAKFGLIVIELHTIPPELTAENIGSTAATAYDATHGFSDQYILEISSFLKVIKEVGLQSDPNYFSKFPDSELATVSINYITGKAT